MKHILRLLILTLFSFPGLGQELGRPFVQSYSPKLYKAQSQNWAVVQDDRGLMYFGNTGCVLEYDGKEWRSIYLPNQVGRSLAKDKNGIIYVGSQSDFGFLAPDSLGTLQYRSLAVNLPEEHQKFNDVWCTHAIADGVYFMTDYKLLRMKYDGSFDRLWTPKSEYFFFTFAVDNTLFAYEKGIGLMWLVNDEFQLIEEGEQFSNSAVFSVIPYLEGEYLLATDHNGLFVYNPKKTGDEAIRPLGGNSAQILKELRIYTATKLNDYLYAFGTRSSGVYVLNASGDIVINTNKNNGLLHNQIFNLGTDEQGGLWACTNKGISRIEIHNPFTYWATNEGVGKVFDIVKFEEELYIATGQSILQRNKQNNQFKSISSLNLQVWSFYKFKNRQGVERLIVGTQDGVYEIKNSVATKIKGEVGGFDIFQPSKFPDHLFVASPEGINVYKVDINQINYIGKIKNYSEEVRSIAEDNDHNIYLGTYYKGVCKLVYNSTEDPLSPEFVVYDTTHGLPSMKEVYIKSISDSLIFTTSNGLYSFNNKNNLFERSGFMGDILNDTQANQLGVLGMDAEENVWYFTKTNVGNVNLSRKECDSVLFKRLPEMEVNAFYNDLYNKGIIWIGGSEGLYRYDKNWNKLTPSCNVVLRKVTLNQDSIIFGGSFYNGDVTNPSSILISSTQNEVFQHTFPYDLISKSVLFEFAALSFDLEGRNQYQYKIEKINVFGIKQESNWSNWSEKTEKEYTNLSEGDYVFKVKAKNIYGIESKELDYSFSISPPWYRSIIAYFVYLLLGIFLIWLIVRFNTVRLQKQNAKLELLVDERTAEILIQNQELQQQQEEIVSQRDYIEEQKKSLEEKNIRIVDSIRYAKTIQEGILPFQERLDKELEEYFLLYRPKDIVSGDFYWFETIDDIKYFAVADCTGHGVPGAFMSMIGSAILNDLVLKNKQLLPSVILEKMNELVVKVLKQQHQGANKDGMDVSLVSWKENANGEVSLVFSGASRPLYCHINDKFQEVAGQRKSIGGRQNLNKSYKDEMLTLRKGDSVFLLSDGYADQHGGRKNRKIGSKQLRLLLETHAMKPMTEIANMLEDYLIKHQGEVDQRDDITVVGIRF